MRQAQSSVSFFSNIEILRCLLPFYLLSNCCHKLHIFLTFYMRRSKSLWGSVILFYRFFRFWWLSPMSSTPRYSFYRLFLFFFLFMFLSLLPLPYSKVMLCMNYNYTPFFSIIRRQISLKLYSYSIPFYYSQYTLYTIQYTHTLCWVYSWVYGILDPWSV